MSGDPASRDDSLKPLGEFVLASVLGEGGSGTVYEAAWGHRRVALKVLRRELIATEHEAARFASEAALIQTVDHPGIVKVLGTGVFADGRPWLAMELLEGETLAARIARGPLSYADSVALIGQLVAAVDALHQRGLVHRDVKPENVMVVRGFAVLLDFGIAKDQAAAASTVTQQGGARGTPAYMAPERFFGAPATIASDVYELAVTFYAMVTGRLPWDSAADPTARLNPPRPSELGVAIPADVETVIMQALSTRAEVRPRSATELGQRIASGGTTPSPRVTTPSPRVTAPSPRVIAPPAQTSPSPLARRSRRRAVVIAIAAALAAGAAIIAVISIRAGAGGHPERPAAPTAPTAAAAASTPDLWGSKSEAAPRERPHPATDWAGAEAALHTANVAMVMNLQPAKLRNSAAVQDAFGKHSDAHALDRLKQFTADCGFDPFVAVTEVTLGVANPGKLDPGFEIVARGTFSRDTFEHCVTVTAKKLDLTSSSEHRGSMSKLVIGGHVVWLAWTDRHTVLATVRQDASWDWLTRRLAQNNLLTASALFAKPLAETDQDTIGWMIVGPEASGFAPLLGITAAPSGAFASLDVSADFTVHAMLRFASTADASAAAKVLGDRLADYKRDAAAALVLGGAAVSVEGTDARFAMQLDATMSRLVAEALVEYANTH
jgi:serine/threonine-protein kinase